MITAPSLVTQLLEAPVDTGEFPDFIHPSRRTQLRTGQHPYGAHPGMDQGANPDNNPEKLASRRYQTMMGRLRTAGAGQRNPAQVIQSVTLALATAVNHESQHKAQLEALAVETVLSLPEFESAAAAYKAGAFKIDAKLTGGENPDLGAGRATPPEQDQDAPAPEGEDDAEIDYAEIDDEKHKRKLVNALIHGAAVNNDYTYQLVKTDLDRLSPELAPNYAKVMAGTQLGYWMVPDETIQAMAAQGGTMGDTSVGMVKLEQEGGKPVIKARGIIFPVLIHELVKGLTELVSYGGLPKVGAMKKAVLKGDTLDAETWDLLLGPEVWRNLSDSIDVKDRRLLMNVYDVLVKLPPDKFHAVTKEISAGGPRAKAAADRLLKAVKEKRKFEGADQATDLPTGQCVTVLGVYAADGTTELAVKADVDFQPDGRVRRIHSVTVNGARLHSAADPDELILDRVHEQLNRGKYLEESAHPLDEFLPAPRFAGPKTSPDIETDPDIQEFPGVDDPDTGEEDEDLPGQDPWRREITPGQEPEPKARRHTT